MELFNCKCCDKQIDVTKMVYLIVNKEDIYDCKWRDTNYYCSDKCLKEDKNG